MGVPTGGGTNLGTAQGRIRIDTGDVRRAQNEVQSASRTMTQALGAVGIAVGAAQLGRFVVQADAVATSYRRQSVAAESLAGSQRQLNDLLRVYDDVTGGAIDKATALNDVTRLLAVGFADTSEELERFVRAARGISVATGQQQDYVISQLQLAIANQSTLRLDQLGLGVEEVQVRIEELRASNSGLTKEMAYQVAILGLAEEKFGALTDSAEAQATGLEKLQKAWKDFQLQFGQGSSGGTNLIFEQWAKDIEQMRRELEAFFNLLDRVQLAGSIFRFNIGLSNAPEGMAAPPMGPQMRPPSARSGPRATPVEAVNQELLDAQADYYNSVREIEQDAARQRLDATRQYGQQRAEAVRSYELSIAREAEDFARNRQRQEQQLAQSILDIHEDAARREADQSEELARTLAQARADSAERLADLEESLARRVAEMRQASADRIADWEEDRDRREEDIRASSLDRLTELEENFQEERERAAADHWLKMRQAAGRLDAVALWQEQQRWMKENKERKEGHEEALTEEQERLQEALNQLNEAHAERLADEQESLDKSIRQANEAHARQVANEKEALDKRIAQAQEAHERQLENAREADQRRIDDMVEADAEQRRIEDEDRAIRLQRQAADHQAQLASMAAAHSAQMAEIDRAEAEQLQSSKDAFDEELAEQGLYNAAYLKKQKEFYEDVDDMLGEYMKTWTTTMEDAMKAAGLLTFDTLPSSAYPSLANPNAAMNNYGPSTVGNNSSVSVSVSMEAGAVQVVLPAGVSSGEGEEMVFRALESWYGSIGRTASQ